MDVSTTTAVLLSWAVHLSGYPAPEQPPQVRFEPHAFFVQNVCAGRECPAVGWYNDAGIVYIDDRYLDDESMFPASLLVHEFVHYLQDMSGEYNSLSCEDSRAREREAYHAQNEYILQAHASFELIRPGPTACNYAVAAFGPVPAHAMPPTLTAATSR